MKIQRFNNEAEWIQASVSVVLEACRTTPDHFRLALSGGSTPAPVYAALATSLIDFSKIELYQVDERCVPWDDPESNHRLISESLLKKLTAPPKEFHAFKATPPTEAAIQESLKIYENQLFDLADHPFTVTILGIGPDGHIASLFPDTAALKEKKRLVTHSQNDHFKIKDRLTLTLPPILASRTILVLAKGRDKEAIIEELEHGKKRVHEFPARALADHPNCIVYFWNGD